MEQKRTLWIVAAAGVFLLVVVGAALLLSVNPEEPVNTYYNPVDGFNVSKSQTTLSPSAPAALSRETSGEGTAPVQLYAEGNTAENNAPSALPGTVPQGVMPVTQDFASAAAASQSSPVKVENVTVITDNALVYGTGTTTTIDLNSLKSNPQSAATVTPQNSYTASQMPSQTPAKEYKAEQENYYAPAPKAKTAAPKKETPVKETKPAAKSSSKAASKATAKTAPKTPAKPDVYWIQVGSYEAKKSADEARSILESNKITNEVFTYKDAKGKLFYRVRTGPYTTKSEAEYWQKRIASTNEFAKTNSYIVKN